MVQRRLRLEGESLEDLRAQARRQFPRARIVSAERVRVGGIAGFLARQHFELVLELPDGVRSGPQAGGLAALLASAEAEEESMRGAPVSTESRRFADLLDALTQEAEDEAGPLDPVGPPDRLGSLSTLGPPAAPRLLRGPGDLVLVVGPERAALEVGATMLGALGLETSGLLRSGSFDREPIPPLEARNRATRARAAGVEDGHAAVIAIGLGRHGTEPEAQAATVRALAADQVWLVVDAGRKTEDTARYVRDVRAAMVIDAVAVEGAGATATPETVTHLEVPIGWVDGSALAESPSGLASVYTLE
ncbi:hypothetical protein OCAE111667_03355 [Occultella aeris]|uniref:Uncharacterized protein n=1 Tax=Occultella aeris TaxID=2761496 RepID=A0A7M4DDF3_9MICO|nr:hypothetical protein [Occultella aeris]VZO34872.1 hypothetical protein HALOF300_00142 [Occultella aeris]